MSLFSDIVNSIGTDKSPAPPKPPARPLSTNSARPVAAVSKPGSRPGFPPTPSPLNGVKRKAEDGSPNPFPEKVIRPNPTPGLSSTLTKRPPAPPLNAPRPTHERVLPKPRPQADVTGITTKAAPTPTSPNPAVSAKNPSKGSFADLMARAKQAQDTKTQNQVGLIKHQATNREKVSKVAERKRQEEEKAKAIKERTGRGPPGKHDKSRSVSPVKRTDQPKVPKVARPPLHAPTRSTYKGTMGTSTDRARKPPHKKSRYDEYLGTDEEEDSDMDGYGKDEEDDYGSDASSDMEAGAFEVDEEEQRALRTARDEDAAEQALENRLKREKEERRRRLTAMAGRRRQ